MKPAKCLRTTVLKSIYGAVCDELFKPRTNAK